MLVLDEPTAGLDPKQIIETRQLIRDLAGNHTIVLSTHILPEVAQTCQRVVIINKGKVVAIDTPDDLTARLHGAATMFVQADGPAADVQRALQSRQRRHRASTSPTARRGARQLRGRLREGRGRAPRARHRRRPRRLGPARAAADADEP